MSNTYKHKDYGKWRRFGDTHSCGWINIHRFRYHKCPRDSKTAKYIIQTLGHRRRRCAERKVSKDILSFRNFNLELYCHDYDWYDDCQFIDQTLEFYDEGRFLEKNFSSPWDYY